MPIRLDIQVDLPKIDSRRVINQFWKGIQVDSQLALTTERRTLVPNRSGRSRRRWKVIQDKGGNQPVFRITNSDRYAVILNNSPTFRNQHGDSGKRNPYFRCVPRTIDKNYDDILAEGLKAAQRAIEAL